MRGASILLAATTAEAGLSAAAILRPDALPTLVLGQGLVSLALAGAAVFVARGGERRPFVWLAILAMAFLGPIGLVGVALAALLHLWFRRHATSFADWHASLFPRRERTRAAILHDTIALRGAGPPQRSSVAPFADVLAFGSVGQKTHAVTMIADRFRPAFADALQAALNDPEPAIRVLAASASARIENTFSADEAACRKTLAARPDDPDAHLALARHVARHAGAGLMASARALDARRAALAAADRAAALRSDDPGAASLAARLLLDLGEPEVARERLAPWMREGATEVTGLMAETLYSAGRYADLRAFAGRNRELLGEAAALWAARP